MPALLRCAHSFISEASALPAALMTRSYLAVITAQPWRPPAFPVGWPKSSTFSWTTKRIRHKMQALRNLFYDMDHDALSKSGHTEQANRMKSLRAVNEEHFGMFDGEAVRNMKRNTKS